MGNAELSDDLFARRPVWGSFVGGRFLEDEATHFDVLESSTGRVLARVASAESSVVDLAVRDARRAYEEVWRDLSPRERGALMRRVAQRIRDHADELAEICAREVGKPRRDALRVDVTSSHTSFDYYGGIADTLHGQIIDQGPIEARVEYEFRVCRDVTCQQIQSVHICCQIRIITDTLVMSCPCSYSRNVTSR